MRKEEIIIILEKLLPVIVSAHRWDSNIANKYMCNALTDVCVTSERKFVIAELIQDVVTKTFLNEGYTEAWYKFDDLKSRITNINRTIKRLQKEIENP